MRYITVDTCNNCPHLTHCGAFGDVAYIPKCARTDRTLPFETKAGVYARYGGQRLTAVPTYVIPSWCPLPDGGDLELRKQVQVGDLDGGIPNYFDPHKRRFEPK